MPKLFLRLLICNWIVLLMPVNACPQSLTNYSVITPFDDQYHLFAPLPDLRKLNRPSCEKQGWFLTSQGLQALVNDNDIVTGMAVGSALENALALFTLAAAEYQGDACCYLFFFYLHGLGTDKDSLKACNYLAKAEAGDVIAAWSNLGYFYEHGIFVAADTLRAMECYRKAARTNERVAQYKIGLFYLHGYGVEADPDIALQWLQKAADQGLEEAAYEAAYIYLNAEGVKRDYNMAFGDFIIASDKNSQAMYWLGWLYEHGKGVARNDTLAVY